MYHKRVQKKNGYINFVYNFEKYIYETKCDLSVEIENA